MSTDAITPDARIGFLLREFVHRRGFEFHLFSPHKDKEWGVSFCYLRDSGDDSGEFDSLLECLEYAYKEANEYDDSRY